MNQDSAVLLRAIRGPVMMITIGTLFALDSLTPFSFNRTWPVLLVVAGILSLGKSAPSVHGKTRYRAQWGPPSAPAPPPPVPTPQPGGMTTAPPGTYRGSTYESMPGSGPRPEKKENRDRAGMPESSAAGNPPGPGGTQ